MKIAMQTTMQIGIIILILLINFVYTYHMVGIRAQSDAAYICGFLSLMGIGAMFLGIHYVEHMAMSFVIGLCGTWGLSMLVWYLFATIGYRNDINISGPLVEPLIGVVNALLGACLSLPLGAANTVGLLLYRWILCRKRADLEAAWNNSQMK